ncbi:unnamed protein product, partial [marine sediment metagenome]
MGHCGLTPLPFPPEADKQGRFVFVKTSYMVGTLAVYISEDLNICVKFYKKFNAKS